MKTFLACLLIFVLATLIYSYDLNVEFQGDDDSLAAGHMVHFAKRLDNPPPLKLKDIYIWLGRWIRNFFFRQHHSPLMSLYCGLFYWAANHLGVPISYQFLSLPLALAAALGVVLFHRLLISLRLSGALLWALTFMFMASPVYVINTRALHSYYMAVVPLVQLITLAVLIRVTKGRSSPWLLGLILAVQALSDILFMVSMALTLSVYAWEGGWAGSKHAIKKLTRPGVVIPPIIALAGVVFFTILKLVDPSVGPNDVTPLSWLLTKTDRITVGPVFDIWSLPVTLSFLFGELSTPLLVGVIVAAVWLRRRLPQGVYLIYSLLALIAYGLIFYVLSHTQSTPFLRQAYLLVPWCLLIALTLKALITTRPTWRPALSIVLWLTVASTAAGAAAAVWRTPTSIFEGVFASARGYNGVKNQNFGTKAAGMVVRQVIGAELTNHPGRQISVKVTSCPPKRLSALIMFTGLAQRGVYFQKKFRSSPLKVEIFPEARQQGGAAKLPGEMLIDLGSDLQHLSGGRSSTTIQIVDQDRLLWSIKIIGAPPRGKAGKLTKSMAALEKEFDKKYHGLYDLFEWA